jgi:S1-C subfamily serine protease
MIGYHFIPVKQGLITYNNHLVGDAKTVAVTFANGNTYTTKVVGTIPISSRVVRV